MILELHVHPLDNVNIVWCLIIDIFTNLNAVALISDRISMQCKPRSEE